MEKIVHWKKGTHTLCGIPLRFLNKESKYASQYFSNYKPDINCEKCLSKLDTSGSEK